MHSHGNPKGSGSDAGQPCKIVECNLGVRRKREPRIQPVVPALSRDDADYRFALACSAELCAASASLAEI
jgi:hypothetical protein